MPGKKTYIEFLRIIACFLVIVNHTNTRIFQSCQPSATWFISIGYFFFCKIAVPLFLIIMGAVLLHKLDTPQKTASRILRIVVVLLIGSVLYYVYYGCTQHKALSVRGFLGAFFQSGITKAYWYLYLYIGLLCLLPILQKMAQSLSKGNLQWLLFLCTGVTGILPILTKFVPGVNFSWAFDVCTWIFSAYVGLVLWGYYIEHYMTITRLKFYLSCLCFIFVLAFQIAATYYLYQKDSQNYLFLDSRTLLTTIAASVSFYVMVKYLFSHFSIPCWLEKTICKIGGLTFGVYLLADLAIDLFTPVYRMLSGHMHILPAMLLWEIFIFAASAAVAFALKQIPFVKKYL